MQADRDDRLANHHHRVAKVNTARRGIVFDVNRLKRRVGTPASPNLTRLANSFNSNVSLVQSATLPKTNAVFLSPLRKAASPPTAESVWSACTTSSSDSNQSSERKSTSRVFIPPASAPLTHSLGSPVRLFVPPCSPRSRMQIDPKSPLPNDSSPTIPISRYALRTAKPVEVRRHHPYKPRPSKSPSPEDSSSPSPIYPHSALRTTLDQPKKEVIRGRSRSSPGPQPSFARYLTYEEGSNSSPEPSFDIPPRPPTPVISRNSFVHPRPAYLPPSNEALRRKRRRDVLAELKRRVEALEALEALDDRESSICSSWNSVVKVGSKRGRDVKRLMLK